jgi:hypothetical protein
LKVIINKHKIFIFSIFAAAVFFLYFPSQSICAGGIVPCKDNCNLCFLLVGISNIFAWGMGALLTTTFLLLVLIAGMTFIVAGAFPGILNFAKQTLTLALKGLVLALCSWLIINSIMNIVGWKGASWWEHECVYSNSDSGSGAGGNSSGGSNTGSGDSSGSSSQCDPENKKLDSVIIQCAEQAETLAEGGSGFYVALDTLSEENKEGKGKTQQLKAIAKYSCDGTASEEDITAQAEWKASDETQVKVSKGLVAAVAKNMTSESPPYVEAKFQDKNSNQAKVYINACPTTTAADAGTGNRLSFSENGLGTIPKANAQAGEPLADAVCESCGQMETTCHYVVGNRDSAKYIFVLMRSNDWFWKDKTENACETKVERWQKENDADLKQFKDKVKEFAQGYKYLNDTDGDFAIYESTQIGSWDYTCPPGEKYYGYGYVYKGTGDRAAAYSGGYATYCMDEKYPAKTFAHEQPGHSFASLDDEYTDSKQNPNNFSSKLHLNCTEDVLCMKWIGKKDSCERGCFYTELALKSSDNKVTSFYRSSENSIMNHHYNASGFDTLNSWIIKYKADNGYLPSSVNQNGQPPLAEELPKVKWP